MAVNNTEPEDSDILKLRIVHSLLQDLTKARFFGKVQLTFERGKITFVKKEETMKLS